MPFSIKRQIFFFRNQVYKNICLIWLYKSLLSILILSYARGRSHVSWLLRGDNLYHFCHQKLIGRWRYITCTYFCHQKLIARRANLHLLILIYVNQFIWNQITWNNCDIIGCEWTHTKTLSNDPEPKWSTWSSNVILIIKTYICNN